MRRFALLAAALLFLVPAASRADQYVVKGPFAVKKVIDGDTLELANGEHIRLIGIDAPELHHPELPVQRFSREAADFLLKTLDGQNVTLEIIPGDERDPYHRLLAYVYAGKKMLNEELIRNGYAFAYAKGTHPRLTQFLGLENEARRAHRGLWDYSPRDGRLANIIERYGALNPEGRDQFDAALDGIIVRYPLEPKTAPPPSPAAAIPWREAEKHEGKTVTVEGLIAATHNSGKACFLNFDKDYKHTLTLVIFEKRFAAFPKNPERYYKGKTVRVTGTAIRHGGRPEIILERPEQIAVLK
ncbi:MAG: thermonuclease family protein [Nitrospinae bacterium]|nr:thermonuclease family protein [Nitrospinota bacterium]